MTSQVGCWVGSYRAFGKFILIATDGLLMVLYLLLLVLSKGLNQISPDHHQPRYLDFAGWTTSMQVGSRFRVPLTTRLKREMESDSSRTQIPKSIFQTEDLEYLDDFV